MKTMRSLGSICGLLILAIIGCTPNTTESSPPTTKTEVTTGSDPQLQPDLIINHMYLEMEGRQGACVNAYSAYGIRVQVKNIGSADTGSFFVDLNGVVQEIIDGLRVGQIVELHFPGTIPSGQYEATVDVTDQVIESREDNNTSSFHAPTPTPPPLCTVTSTATP